MESTWREWVTIDLPMNGDLIDGQVPLVVLGMPDTGCTSRIGVCLPDSRSIRPDQNRLWLAGINADKTKRQSPTIWESQPIHNDVRERCRDRRQGVSADASPEE